MSLEATPIAKAERIPLLVREAAKFVPVGDYLKVRFWGNRPELNRMEWQQLQCGREAVEKWAKNHDIVYDFGNIFDHKINPPDNLLISAARTILKNVPLSQYLSAHQEHLVSEIVKNNLKIQQYDEGLEGEHLDTLEARSVELSNDLDLTSAVAQAARITLP